MDEFDQRHCFKCNQHNLLSKSCLLCKNVFCPEHLRCENHDCPESWRIRNEKVPICPICNKMIDDKVNVALPEIDKLNFIVSTHIESGCKMFVIKENEKKLCEVDGCENKKMMRCKLCMKWICLSHRHMEDHNCSGFKNKNTKTENKPKFILNPFLAKVNAQKENSVNNSNKKLKIDYFENISGSPIGQNTIEVQDRIYVDVFYPYRSKRKATHFYFSKKWPIGKIIDKITSHGNIRNQNAETQDPTKRLQLYSLPSGVILPVSETFQDLINKKIIPPRGKIPVILEYGPNLDEEIKELAVNLISGKGLQYMNQSSQNSQNTQNSQESSECIIQ